MYGFKWALRDKKGLERLIDDLDFFNNDLHSTLTPLVRSLVEFGITTRLLAETEDISQLRVIQEVSQNNNALRDTAWIWAFNLQADNQTQKSTPELELPILALQNSTSGEGSSAPRELHRLHNSHGFVEKDFFVE